MRKKLPVVFGVLSLALVLAALPFMAACAQPTPTGPITLKLVTFLPVFIETSKTSGEYARRVTEQSNGELIIDWVGGPEVVPMEEIPEAVRTGAIDMVLVPSGWYEALVPEGGAFTLSEVSLEERRKNGFYDWMFELHKENMNAYYLGQQDLYYPFYLWLKVGVEGPQELAGLKIGDTGLMPEFAPAFGGTSVHVNFGDVYSALERGVIDGFLMTATTVADLSIFEVTKYGIKHGLYGAADAIILINLDKWNSLPKHLQKLMKDVFLDFEPEREALQRQIHDEGWQTMLGGGVEAITFSAEDAKFYRDTAYEAAWATVKKKASPESYDRLRELLSK